MRNFTIEDFSGAGQYLVANRKEENKFVDTGFLSTIMYKVGYIINNDGLGNGEQLYCLISMSDGQTRYCYYPNFSNNHSDPNRFNKNYFQGNGQDKDGKQVFCDYLNNADLTEEYRFATQEEVVRVVMYQRSRWK